MKIAASSVLLAVGLVVLSLSAGCRRTSEVTVNPAEHPNPTVSDAGGEKPQVEVLEDALFLCFVDATPVGTERRTLDKTQAGLKQHVVSTLSLQRFGEASSARVEHVELLQADGALRSFDTRISLGGADLAYTGRLVDRTLKAEIATYGKEETRELPMPADVDAVFGGYAADVSLRQKPMKPGETRSCVGIEPTTLAWVQLEMVCENAENVTRPDGKTFPLCRVKVRSKLLAANGTETPLQKETFWCDGVGKVWKKHSELLNMTSWRVSAEEAEQFIEAAAKQEKQARVKPDTAGFDLGKDFSVPLKVEGKAGDIAAAKTAVYCVHVRDDSVSPAKVLQPGAFQQLEEIDAQTVRVRVSAADEESRPRAAKSQNQPLPTDSKANALIQSDAPLIEGLAEQAAGGETEPAKLAPKLERFVHGYITDKNYARGFVTAAEVAEHPAGDCTEHAVLFAALARAKRIPTRIVQGLIYVPEMSAFVWHVWNECWIDGVWQPYDATRGQGVVGPDHLRINASDFDSQTLASALVPVAQLVGKLEIALEEVQP